MKHIAKLARKFTAPIGLVGSAFITNSAHAAAAALPADYTAIGTDADATFGWAKAFAITVIIFGFVVSLVKLAKRR